MNMANDLATRLLHDYPALPEQRAAAVALLRTQGLPDSGSEHWRHANLRPLAQVRAFHSAGADSAVAAQALPTVLDGYTRIVCINGQFSAALSAPPAALEAAGLQIDARPALPGRGEALRFALLNALFAPQRLTLRVRGSNALEIVHLATAAASAGSSYPTLELHLTAGAQLKLVERHLGSPGAQTLVSAALNLQLERDAQLEFDRLQQLGDDVLFLDQLQAELDDNAALRVRNIATGGASTHLGAQIHLGGRNAELQWLGLAVAHDTQVHDALLRVEHAAPGTRTDQVFRALAAGRGRVACNGDMLVSAAARGAQLTQSLRGLIDGAGAEIDLRPRLEIHTDDIKAAHGATTGQLDENLLFYLLSRGVPRDTARALLKWAFLGDVLRAIRIPELRRAAETAAAGHLADVLATGALS
ncbi:MAG: SufD family Fe-S cluster assembly protein [Steroidobacteraceae bacterium]